MKNKVTIGVVGCGYWGPNYVRVFNELPSSSVLWCCDIDSDRLRHMKRLYPNVRISKNYREILEDAKVDAVVISTPASTHYQIAMEAMENNKHVLIEKPMATSTKQAEQLYEKSTSLGKVMVVGHTYIYHPAIQKIKDFISRNELGKIYYMHFVRTGLGPIRRDVNALWDLAPHDISISLYLLENEPSTIVATGASYIQKGIEDVVTTTLYFPNNVMVNIHVSWLDAVKTRRLGVVGSKRMLLFDDVESLERIRVFDKGVWEHHPSSYGEFRLLLREGDIHVPRIEPIEPLKVMCQHFMDCIQRGTKMLTDAENGVKVVKILEAAQKSLKNKSACVQV